MFARQAEAGRLPKMLRDRMAFLPDRGDDRTRPRVGDATQRVQAAAAAPTAAALWLAHAADLMQRPPTLPSPQPSRDVARQLITP